MVTGYKVITNCIIKVVILGWQWKRSSDSYSRVAQARPGWPR